MRDPDATKETILKKSGVLFNTHGYKATSISDITKATGFTKGAIYRHFTNKVELEIETLSSLEAVMFEKMRERIKSQKTAPQKLRAILHFFESYITDPPVKGGCPLLNSAIEADDSNPALRKRALGILNGLRVSLVAVLDNGIQHGQLKRDIDKELYATLIIASLEGAIMMSKLSGKNDDIVRVITYLEKEIAKIET